MQQEIEKGDPVMLEKQSHKKKGERTKQFQVNPDGKKGKPKKPMEGAQSRSPNTDRKQGGIRDKKYELVKKKGPEGQRGLAPKGAKLGTMFT